MTKTVAYHWHLRKIMNEHGMNATTELVPLLADRGVVMTSTQVYRIVVGQPERLNMAFLSALCDIFECESTDLFTTTATDVRVRKTGASSPPNVVSLDRSVRPRRANILDE